MNSYKQSLYTSLVRIAANIIMLGAIFFAMYQAGRWPGWPSEAVFCLCFFGIALPEWVLAIFLTKWIRKKYPSERQSMVALPGLGRQLVRWRVLDGETPFPLSLSILNRGKTAGLSC